eukprot:TRINITY_DN1164_c0_g1_i1.p1 TRINITY_DN1164_c0_g1~~TRINITY_DN1164_c0_g1_i1.p1  ORF type:complete len:1076 (+),score=199.87 TRINITY_DN1164_c0_g1_i1:54-3281(+)
MSHRNSPHNLPNNYILSAKSATPTSPLTVNVTPYATNTPPSSPMGRQSVFVPPPSATTLASPMSPRSLPHHMPQQQSSPSLMVTSHSATHLSQQHAQHYQPHSPHSAQFSTLVNDPSSQRIEQLNPISPPFLHTSTPVKSSSTSNIMHRYEALPASSNKNPQIHHNPTLSLSPKTMWTSSPMLNIPPMDQVHSNSPGYPLQPQHSQPDLSNNLQQFLQRFDEVCAGLQTKSNLVEEDIRSDLEPYSHFSAISKELANDSNLKMLVEKIDEEVILADHKTEVARAYLIAQAWSARYMATKSLDLLIKRLLSRHICVYVAEILFRKPKLRDELTKYLKNKNCAGHLGSNIVSILSLLGHSFSGFDFSGMDLRSADFSGAILHKANFSNSKLDNAVFNLAYLDGCNLQGASLTNAQFDFVSHKDCNSKVTGIMQLNSDGLVVSTRDSIFYENQITGEKVIAYKESETKYVALGPREHNKQSILYVKSGSKLMKWDTESKASSVIVENLGGVVGGATSWVNPAERWFFFAVLDESRICKVDIKTCEIQYSSPQKDYPLNRICIQAQNAPNPRFIVLAKDGTLHDYKISSQKLELLPHRFQDAVHLSTATLDSHHYLAVTCKTKTVVLKEVYGGYQEIATIQRSQLIQSCSELVFLDYDRMYLLTGDSERVVNVWNIADGCKHVYTLGGFSKAVLAIQADHNPSSNLITIRAGDESGIIKEWSIAPWDCVKTQVPFASSVECVTTWVTNEGVSIIAAGNRDGSVQIRHSDTGMLMHGLNLSKKPITSIACFTISGVEYAFAGDASGKIYAKSLADNKKEILFSPVSDKIHTLAKILRDSNEYILIGAVSGAVVIWDFLSQEAVVEYNLESGSCEKLLLLPNEPSVVYAISGADVVSLEIPAQVSNEISKSPLLTAELSVTSSAVVCTPGISDRILLTADDGSLNVFEVGNSEPIQNLFDDEVEADATALCAFSLDGKYYAAVGFSDGHMSIWSLDTYEITLRLRAHTLDIKALSYDPSTQIMATASRDRNVRMWKLSTNEEGSLDVKLQSAFCKEFSALNCKVDVSKLPTNVKSRFDTPK